MSITDELRKWVNESTNDYGCLAVDSDCDASEACQQLYAIADRIDKAHDKALRDCIHDPAIAADYWEAIIAERYIELPKDKNGKTVLIGDMVKSQEHRGRIREVIGIRLSEKVNVWSLEFHVSEGGSEFAPANRCELVEPDTQEKLDCDVRSLFDCNVDVTPEIIQDLLRRQRELDGTK